MSPPPPNPPRQQSLWIRPCIEIHCIVMFTITVGRFGLNKSGAI
jgi:hypothetical protein